VKRLSLTALLLLTAAPLSAEEKPDKDACFAPVAPIVSLDYGSRYTADSETRSDFDEKSNAEVEKALGPLDDFVTDLARESNRAMTRKEARATKSADCVLDHLAAWARAGALADLKTESVQLSLPSRLSGLAFAYANALPFASDDPDRRAVIEAWFKARAMASIAFFDTEAPPRASANNLRAWAGLAVTRIGLLLQDENFLTWGDQSFRKVICDLNPDGSLPREMERGPLALHYQIHAMAPLAITAALLQERDAALFDACDKALPRAVDFTLKALQDPDLAAQQAGTAQSYSGENPETLQAFEIAWAPAYLRFVDNPELAQLAKAYDPLANSKFGGDQLLLWTAADPEAPATE
jgi:poly(beta-D-mannuronate) lyase